MLGDMVAMKSIGYIFSLIFSGFVLSGCSDSALERMANKYDVSEHEAATCLIAFGAGASDVLQYLLEQRMPFPLSFFSDDCYDFINYTSQFTANYQDVIVSKKMGWELGGEEFYKYIAEKEVSEAKKREIEESARLEREAAERKLADEEMEYRHKKYNEEYVRILLGMMKDENRDSLENIARSYVDFFYYPKIQFLKENGSEFDVKDYVDKKVREVIEESKSAQEVPYDRNSFGVELGEYDFGRGAFSVVVARQIKSVRLHVPCLHPGLRGVCLDGRRYDGGTKYHSKIPTGVLPLEIYYYLSGVPAYLYVPEDEARKIRNGGPLHIVGDIHVSRDFSGGIVYLDAKSIRLLDFSGNIIARMCSRGEKCEGVFLSN